MRIQFSGFNQLSCLMLGLAAASAILTGQARAAMLEIAIVPSETEVHVGETFTVDLVANILGGGSEELAVWGMDLNVSDPSLVSQTNLTIDSSWTPFDAGDGDGLAGWTVPESGDAIAQNNIHLATVSFTAESAGELNLMGSYANDGFEAFGFIDVADDFAMSTPESVEFLDASVTVVPLPATIGLAALGFGTLVLARRRIKVA